MGKSIAYFYVSIVILLWASFPAVIKILLTNLDNFQVLFFLTLIATISLFLITLFQKKIKMISKYKPKDYLNFAYMGLIGVFLYHLFFFGSLMFLSTQEALIVNYLWPIMLVVFSSSLLKEEFTAKKIISTALSFLGVYVVISKGNFSSLTFLNPLGILLAFLGAVCYGLFSALGKKYDYDKTLSMFFYYLFSLFFITLVTPLFSAFTYPTLKELIGLLWLGVAASGIGFVLWFLALKHGETSTISNIIYLTPFVALVYIYFLLGEKILFSSIIGLLIIISSVFLQLLNPNASKPTQSPDKTF